VKAAPSLPITPVVPRPGARNPLALPVLARKGRSILVSTASARAGILQIRAFAGSKPLGACLTRTPARRSLTCRLALRPSVGVRGVRVVVRLLVGGSAVATRRATYARALTVNRGSALQCWLGPGSAKPAKR
jgi:hypothetical protein